LESLEYVTAQTVLESLEYVTAQSVLESVEYVTETYEGNNTNSHALFLLSCGRNTGHDLLNLKTSHSHCTVSLMFEYKDFHTRMAIRMISIILYDKYFFGNGNFNVAPPG
jgi:hypothetical protein